MQWKAKHDSIRTLPAGAAFSASAETTPWEHVMEKASNNNSLA